MQNYKIALYNQPGIYTDKIKATKQFC